MPSEKLKGGKSSECNDSNCSQNKCCLSFGSFIMKSKVGGILYMALLKKAKKKRRRKKKRIVLEASEYSNLNCSFPPKALQHKNYYCTMLHTSYSSIGRHYMNLEIMWKIDVFKQTQKLNNRVQVGI